MFVYWQRQHGSSDRALPSSADMWIVRLPLFWHDASVIRCFPKVAYVCTPKSPMSIAQPSYVNTIFSTLHKTLEKHSALYSQILHSSMSYAQGGCPCLILWNVLHLSCVCAYSGVGSKLPCHPQLAYQLICCPTHIATVAPLTTVVRMTVVSSFSFLPESRVNDHPQVPIQKCVP